MGVQPLLPRSSPRLARVIVDGDINVNHGTGVSQASRGGFGHWLFDLMCFVARSDLERPWNTRGSQTS